MITDTRNADGGCGPQAHAKTELDIAGRTRLAKQPLATDDASVRSPGLRPQGSGSGLGRRPFLSRAGPGMRTAPSWPLILLAAPAAVAVWPGWVRLLLNRTPT